MSFSVLRTTMLNLPADSTSLVFYHCTHVHRRASPSQTHMLEHTFFLLAMHLFLFSIHRHNHCYTFMQYSSCTLSNAHTQSCTNVHACTYLKIHPERLLCGIQSQCLWLESLSTASDVTSARSVSCSPPPFPYSLPLSYPLSSAEPIFWHFRRCSSHACHLSPPPPTLSSQLSIESMRLCLKLMYFVELTLWRLHHLEVGKWYWTERLVFKERRALKHSVLVWHGELENITPKRRGGKWLFHLYTCTSLQLWTADCEEGGRLGTYVSPWCKKTTFHCALQVFLS